MSRTLIGNLFLLASILCAVSSQLILKTTLDGLAPAQSGWRQMAAALDSRLGGWLLASAVLVVAGYGFWVASLTRLELSWAYPVACSSLLLVVLFSAVFLGEPLTARKALASLLILAGVILLAPVT